MSDVFLRTRQDIKLMKEGGEKLGRILSDVLKKIKPGVSTLEIDTWIEDRIADLGGVPSFKLVPGYKWASCVGLNEEVVHSIPRKDKIIKEGDLLKVDLGMCYKGFHTDLAWTVEVQNVPPNRRGNTQYAIRPPANDLQCRAGNTKNEKFLEAGERALEEAIKVAKAGNRIGHISRKIEEVIRKAGFRPVEALTGHGIGKELHEDPLIPGVLKRSLKDTSELIAGMTLALEVIYGQGNPEVVLQNDGWTIVTRDGKMAGLFEKTIAVTETQPLILTPLFSKKG